MMRTSRYRDAVLVCSVAVIVASCGADSTLVVDHEPAQIVAIGDTLFAGTVGRALATSPTVVVRNKAGVPLAGVPVSFSVAAGNGIAGASFSSTDVNGQASVGWILGPARGSQRLVATVSSLTLGFTATAASDEAARITKVDGDSQQVVVDTKPAKSLTARVVDRFGNAVGGVSVIATVRAGGGAFAGTTQSSDDDGIVRFTGWTIGTRAVTNQLELSASNSTIATAVFSVIAVAGPVDTLVFSPVDTLGMLPNTSASIAFHAADRFGNAVSASALTFTSSNPAVASVAGSVVAAKAGGQTVITAAANGMSASRPVVVASHLTGNATLAPLAGAFGVATTNGRVIAAISPTGPPGSGGIITLNTAGIPISNRWQLFGPTVLQVAPTRDGSTVVTASTLDNSLTITEMANGAATQIRLPASPAAGAVSPDDRRAVFNSGTQMVVVDLQTRSISGSINVGGYAGRVLFVSDTMAFVGTATFGVFWIDVKNLRVVRSLTSVSPSRGIALSLDEKYIYSASPYGPEISVYRASDGAVVGTSTFVGTPGSLMISADGTELYTADQKTITVFSLADPESPRIARAIQLPDYVSSSMSMDRRGTFLVIGSASGVIFVR